MTIGDLKAANERYAAAFANADLAAAPGRRLAVVTCMDARLDPARFLGLNEGDAHVIRNAGGIVTDDVLRSLAVSHWLLGTQEAIVIAHTECGLQATEEELRRKLEARGAEVGETQLHAFADLDDSVRESVRRIDESPLLPPSFGASGFVYDVRTGRLRAVE